MRHRCEPRCPLKIGRRSVQGCATTRSVGAMKLPGRTS
ncbi:hypothetical protein DB356_02410 [Pseudomonas congelans]|nr:hypothetical protein DB356_02410 [Pseudomonas congelans]